MSKFYTIFRLFLIVCCLALGISCKHQVREMSNCEVEGTWLLVSSQYINANQVTNNLPTGHRCIKIINKTHFAFLMHSLTKDSSDNKGIFEAGGGTYTLTGNSYTEHLEYCNYREYEGIIVPFTFSKIKDTLVLKGMEEIPNSGGSKKYQVLVEKYLPLESSFPETKK